MERRLNPATDRVLVTGATGFLGSWTVDRLLSEGVAVTAVGRNAARGAELAARGARFVPAALEDAAAVDAAVAGHTDVVHSGALSSPWGRYEDFFAANVTGTENVARACLRHGVRRLVHISTPGIYIDARDRLLIREDEPLPPRPVNFYADTKLQAERGLAELVRESGLPVVILRPQGIFGPGDTALLPRLVRVAKKGFVPVIRTDQAVMDLTAVENVVEAIFCALTAGPETVGRAYNVTNGEPGRGIELIETVLDGLGLKYRRKHLSFRKAWAAATALEWLHRNVLRDREPLITRHTVCALGFSRTLDITAARRELGYVPRVALRDALTRFIAWSRESAS